MESLFSGFEPSMYVAAILVVFWIALFIVGRISFKEAVVLALLTFALEHEYLNFSEHPEKSIVQNIYKRAASAVNSFNSQSTHHDKQP
jgi:hypothetical protein